MKSVNVENVNWNPEGITEKTEIDFVEKYMSDPGTYPFFDKDRKEKALRLAWKMTADSAIEPKPQGNIQKPGGRPATLAEGGE